MLDYNQWYMFINLNKGGNMNISKTQPKVAKNVSRETQPKVDLQKTTWTQVQDVANGEKLANGKMLFITRNLFSMYKNGKLDVSNYFDKTANDKAVKNIFFDADNKRKTLIAKDFGQFANLVLIPALGQNLVNFQKDFAYEYRVLVDVAPAIMFLICNEQYFKVDEMLNEETNPVEIELPWKMFKFEGITDTNERIFRHNFVKKFFQKSEHGKQFYCTFRGDRGFLAVARNFFTPKKVENENVENATKSPFMKAIEKINDVKEGILGTAKTITQVAQSEVGKNGNAEKRLVNEINELFEMASKGITLISENPHPYAAKKLQELYCLIVGELQSDNFRKYEKANYPKVKTNYNPNINNKIFDVAVGDLDKYLKNISN